MNNLDRVQSILTTLKALMEREDLNQLPIGQELKQVDNLLDDCLEAETE